MGSRILLFSFILFFIAADTHGQKTEIRGFADVIVGYKEDKAYFALEEQDLFITSQLNDRFSFLGETVFKPALSSSTDFAVSIERIIIKYNVKGNHNLLVGKHHTPVNYWNDNYHHGRVFFPTIFRPLMFTANIFPIHTTGISLRAQNLGKLKFGYDLMIGNGIGSNDFSDNDNSKSITAAVHFKPYEGLRIGVSLYNDDIAEGSQTHDGINAYRVKQNIITGSVAYFGEKIELLTEGSLTFNNTDTTGTQQTIAVYGYLGYKIKEKIVPYVRFDLLDYADKEVYYHKNNTTSFVGGIRYNINYLIALKFEYEYRDSKMDGNSDMFSAQLAVGF